MVHMYAPCLHAGTSCLLNPVPACLTPAPQMFKAPEPVGRYNHPWYKPLPSGRARIYDLAYKATSTALFAFACYGLVELGRGCYYIASANHAAAAAPAAAEVGAA